MGLFGVMFSPVKIHFVCRYGVILDPTESNDLSYPFTSIVFPMGSNSTWIKTQNLFEIALKLQVTKTLNPGA
jgi:hypothetical protein